MKENPFLAQRPTQETRPSLEVPDAIRALVAAEFLRSGKATDGFVAELRHENANESDAQLEDDLKRIRTSYTPRKKNFVSSFLARYRRLAADAVVVLALASHESRQQVPDFLEPPTPQSVEHQQTPEPTWNAETQKELTALCHGYAKRMKDEYRHDEAKPTEAFFEKRFMDFARTYLPDMQITDLADRGEIYKEADRALFAFSGRSGKADTTPRGVHGVWYSIKANPDAEDRLNDFLDEIPHVLQRDDTWRRTVQYAEGLVHAGMNQPKMYGDVYSNEFQAHSVTEGAVQQYFFPRDKKFDFEFAEIYNLVQEYYRAYIAGMRDFEKREPESEYQRPTADYFFNVRIRKGYFSFLKEHKETILENVEHIRQALDLRGEEMSQTQKAELFDDALLQTHIYDHSIDAQHLLSAMDQTHELRGQFLRDEIPAANFLQKVTEGLKSTDGEMFANVLLYVAAEYDLHEDVYHKIGRVAEGNFSEDKISALRLAEILEYLYLQETTEMIDKAPNLHNTVRDRLGYDRLHIVEQLVGGPHYFGPREKSPVSKIQRHREQANKDTTDIKNTIKRIESAPEDRESILEEMRGLLQRIKHWGVQSAISTRPDLRGQQEARRSKL